MIVMPISEWEKTRASFSEIEQVEVDQHMRCWLDRPWCLLMNEEDLPESLAKKLKLLVDDQMRKIASGRYELGDAFGTIVPLTSDGDVPSS